MRSSRWCRFIHTPLGKAGVHLLARRRRCECRGCGRAWEDDLSRVAADGRRLTEAVVWWSVASVVPGATETGILFTFRLTISMTRATLLYFLTIAPNLHFSMQAPHLMHLAWLTT